MVSHKSFGGIELSIGAGGLRFKKRPSARNICIGKKMEGDVGPIHGGRYDTAFQDRFAAASRGCPAQGAKPKTAKKKKK